MANKYPRRSSRDADGVLHYGKAAPTLEERVGALIRQLPDPTGEADDPCWTEAGLPQCDVLSEMAGERISADVRNAAWDLVKAEVAPEEGD